MAVDLTYEIYGVDETGQEYTAEDNLRLIEHNPINTPGDLRQKMFVSGLRPGDLACVIHGISVDSDDSVTYVVTVFDTDEFAAIVPLEDVLERPDDHVNDDFARRLTLVSKSFIELMGLRSLEDTICSNAFFGRTE